MKENNNLMMGYAAHDAHMMHRAKKPGDRRESDDLAEHEPLAGTAHKRMCRRK